MHVTNKDYKNLTYIKLNPSVIKMLIGLTDSNGLLVLYRQICVDNKGNTIHKIFTKKHLTILMLTIFRFYCNDKSIVKKKNFKPRNNVIGSRLKKNCMSITEPKQLYPASWTKPQIEQQEHWHSRNAWDYIFSTHVISTFLMPSITMSNSSCLTCQQTARSTTIFL